MRDWKLYIFIFAALLSLQACNKDKKDETKNQMDGKLSLSFPKFVAPDYAKTFSIDTLMTLSRSDGGVIGYYYRDLANQSNDTLVTPDGTVVMDKFIIIAPKVVGEHSFSFGSFSVDDYYGKSTSCSFIVVKSGFNGDNSLTNAPFTGEESVFEDSRDSKKYIYASIDGTDWMLQNLAWDGAGYAFSQEDVMGDVFGRYYSWTDAQNACPAGWRLPNDDDWLALAQNFVGSSKPNSDLEALAGHIMGDIYFNGKKMWEFQRDVKITNSSTLSLIPVGYAVMEDDKPKFDYVYQYAMLWTSDSEGDKGVCRNIYQDKPIVYRSLLPKDDVFASVRCVR